MKDKITERLSTYVGAYHKAKLLYFVFELKLPITRLLAIALDNELSKEKPFGDFDFTLPSDEVLEYAYADQAGKILKYMKDVDGMGIDQILLIRHDIGIPDKHECLQGLRECINKGFLESYKKTANRYAKTEFPDDYLYYRIPELNPKAKAKIRKKATQFERYQKLKKKFKDE